MIESEVEPQMMIQIDTGKHRAVCAALNIPIDTPADAILDMVVDNLSLLDIFRRGFGWIEAQRFKRDAAKKGGKP